jgi:alpha-D-xyloside xylohydrolase
MQLGGLLGDWREQLEMQWVEQITGVDVDGRRVIFTCRTNRGEVCTVVIAACAQNVLRLTLLPPHEHPADQLPVPMVLAEELEPTTVEVDEQADQVTLTFGRLSVVVTRQPWELRLCDTIGRVVVGEHRGDTNLRGWRRTRWLGYARDDTGRISRCYEAFALRPDERIFGLGEKFMPLDKRGRVIDSWNWNTWGSSNERAYKNIPFYLSTAGYGCFVHTTRRVMWDFGSGRESSVSLSFEVEGPSLDLFLIEGSEFASILERYTELTGRPRVPAMVVRLLDVVRLLPELAGG